MKDEIVPPLSGQAPGGGGGGGGDLHVAGPQGEVVAQQLHDERAVLVRLLAQRIQLRNRLVKRLRRSRNTSEPAVHHCSSVLQLPS